MVVSPDSQLKFEAVQILFRQLRKSRSSITREYNNVNRFYEDVTGRRIPNVRLLQTADGRLTIEHFVQGEWQHVPNTSPADYLNRLEGCPDMATFVKRHYC